MPKDYIAKATKDGYVLTPDRLCARCVEPLPKDADAKLRYCSRRCRNRAYQDRMRAKLREWAESRASSTT